MVEGFLEQTKPHAFRVSEIVAAAKQAVRHSCFDEEIEFRKCLKREGWSIFEERLSFGGRKEWVLLNTAMNSVLADCVIQEKRKILREHLEQNKSGLLAL